MSLGGGITRRAGFEFRIERAELSELGADDHAVVGVVFILILGHFGDEFLTMSTRCRSL